MRTKALIGLALIGASALATLAQGNVNSANVGAFNNITIPAHSSALIANQLETGNNTLNKLIPNPPPGSQFFKFKPGVGFVAYTFGADLKWMPDGEATLNPGEGGFFKNPTASPVTLSFTGSVPMGNQTNSLPAGYFLCSSPVACSGKITTDLEFPATPGDEVFIYTAGRYDRYVFDEKELKWTPAEPVLRVNQAFFCNKKTPGKWITKGLAF